MFNSSNIEVTRSVGGRKRFDVAMCNPYSLTLDLLSSSVDIVEREGLSKIRLMEVIVHPGFLRQRRWL